MASPYFTELAAQCVALGAPVGFAIVEAALVGGDGKHKNFTHCRCRGAVYADVTRGRRKGEPNWRKPLPGTKREFYLLIGEAS